MILLNDVLIISTLFPDKTSQVWKIPEQALEPGGAYIKWEFESEDEIMLLAQLKDLLDSKGILVSLLEIKYLPYARQDKSINNNQTFALHSFAGLLNSLKFSTITCLDAHSKVAAEVIDNLTVIDPTREIENAIKHTKPDLLCYPDAGAMDKYTTMSGLPYVYGEKVRDQETGYITSYKLKGDVKGKSVLIVDDICDGGMTFCLLTEQLLDAGATEVNLYVTHGIFSKGLSVLTAAGIKRIFTRRGEARFIEGSHGSMIAYM